MTPLKAVEAFQEIWEFWPNRDDKGGSMTGLKYIATSEGLSKDKLVLAARCYALEADTEYCHRLGNWMRDGHYLGWYSFSDKDLKAEYEAISKRVNDSRKMIEYWNKCHDSCEKFYPCLAVEDRIHLVKKAMKNQFFSENWEKALRKLFLLLRSSWSDDDPRNFIKPTVQWFCMTQSDKFQVAKILEGEYGDPPRIRKDKQEQDGQAEAPSDFSDPDEALNFFNTL